MTWWALTAEDEDPAQPFTIVLSVGAPTPVIGRPGSTDGDREHRPDDDASGRNWMWQEAVSALLHTVFARGGTVAARFNAELFPILWATARVYGEPGSAEHGERHSDAPLEILTDNGYWYDAQAEDSSATNSISAFEATGAVRVRRERRTADDSRLPGPPPHFGIVLWPGPLTETDMDLMEHVARVAIVSPFERSADSWGRGVERIHLGDEPPPFPLLFENRLNDWLQPPI